MRRTIVGALVAAIAMFFLGFVFYATPLKDLAYGRMDNKQATAVQKTLSDNFRKTGTYLVPGVGTPEEAEMYAKGPIATVHYTAGGFPPVDPTALAGGFLLSFITALLICAALREADRRATGVSRHSKLVILFSVAASAFIHLSRPIFYHHDWAHYLYLATADGVILAIGGLIIARWFLPARADQTGFIRSDTNDG